MIEQLIERFLSKPTYLDMGAGKLSARWGTDKESIYKAKIKAREIINGSERAILSDVITEQEDVIAHLISEKVTGDTKEIQYSSIKPLNRKEIEDIYGIDNLSTRLSTYWNKQLPSGKYIVSANIKCLVSDFFTEEEFTLKLSTLYKDISQVKLPEVYTNNTERAMFVYIADDHAGLQFNSSLFGNQWNKEIYRERMLGLVSRIKAYDVTFDHIFIVRMGDEADGWNGKTTRYDHDLGSASNKDQFDIFTEVNKEFYDSLFMSGIAANYTVISCTNSNHSGNGLSYIYHKTTEFYVQARFPEVMFLPINTFMGYIEWGNHVIGLTHGKDEKFMKGPFPLNLDQKTDLWLYDYYDNKGFSPNKRWVSTIKGDIHKYNINRGKSGRYVNVPSISGSSEWIEHNFGNTKAGALIEIYYKNHRDISSLSIEFD